MDFEDDKEIVNAWLLLKPAGIGRKPVILLTNSPVENAK